ncbi:MAG: deoxyribodipyrimidine photo-lyase, partial [Planctomycetia bacterium]|nr:deoxyribodipyrimidine photo-lyase [Planctomycetia bacterium]
MSIQDAMPSASARVRPVLDRPVNADGKYVLYWMTSARRVHWNFALQRAVEWARALTKPLFVFEPLRCDYHWASDRLHTFVIEGMANNALLFAKRRVAYFPYIEPERGADRGLLSALSTPAAVVVTDDFPAFFLPGMLSVAARQLNTRLEAVDSNGLVPLSNTDRLFHRAVDFRRYMQRELPAHVHEMPLADPLTRVKLPAMKIPREILRRWPAATPAKLNDPAAAVRGLPIDHSVGPAAFRGGSAA